MHLLIAGFGALVVGTGDFIGGTASRRDRPHAVALASFAVGTICLFVPALFVGGSPGAVDLFWGAISGIGGAIGVFTLYRGFTRAPMGLVSPIASVVGAAIPVVGGIVLGEQVTLLVAVGLAIGAAAIVALSRGSDAAGVGAGAHARLSGVIHGVITGVGFGILLMALALIGDDTGLFPVVTSRATSSLLLLGQGLAVQRRPLWPSQGARSVSGLAGIFTSAGNLLFVLAVAAGPIVESSAVYALFPAATVLMARIAHAERLTGAQLVGVGMALVAAVLLAIGSVG